MHRIRQALLEWGFGAGPAWLRWFGAAGLWTGSAVAWAQQPGERLVLQNFEASSLGLLSPISTWAWTSQMLAEADSYSRREVRQDEETGNRFLEVWVSPDLPAGSFHFPFETHLLFITGESLLEPTADALRFRYRVLEGRFGMTTGGATVYFGNSDAAATPQILDPEAEWRTAEFRLDRDLVRTQRRASFSAQATAIHYTRWVQEPLSLLLLPAESSGTIQIDDIELVSYGFGRTFASFAPQDVTTLGEPLSFVQEGQLAGAFTFTHFSDDFRRSHTGEPLAWPPALLAAVQDPAATNGVCFEARITGKEERSFIGLRAAGDAGANAVSLRIKMTNTKAFTKHSLDLLAYAVPESEQENFPWDVLGAPPEGAVQEGFDVNLSQAATAGLNYAFYHARRIVPNNEWTTLIVPWSDFAAAYGSGTLRDHHLQQLPCPGGNVYFLGLVPSFRQRTGQTRILIDEARFVHVPGTDAELRSYAQPMGPGDREPPAVTLSGTEMATPGAFHVSVEFSEPVEGLELEDFFCENGRLLDLTGAGSSYLTTVVATNEEVVRLRLPLWSVRDAAGNGNLGSDVAELEHSRAESPVVLAMRIPGASTAAPVRIRFPRFCANPVVLATPEYARGHPPAVARVEELSGEGCIVRLDRLDGVSGPPGEAALHVVVLETGLWPRADGSAGLEALRGWAALTSRKGSWKGEPSSYLQSFSAPVVLGQVLGMPEHRWSVFWACGGVRGDPPSAAAFQLGKHVAEDPDSARPGKQLGCTVIESGQYDFGAFRFEAGVGPDIVRHISGTPAYYYNFTGEFGPDAVVTLAMAGINGVEGCWPVAHPGAVDAAARTLRVAVDEDQLLDTERSHGVEQLAWALWERNPGADDGLAPVAVLTAPQAVVSESFAVRVTFSEPVEGFGPEDVEIDNGELIQFGADAVGFKMLIAPLSPGETAVTVLEDAVVDESGVGNIASEALRVAYAPPENPPEVWTAVVPASTAGPTEVALPDGFVSPVVLATIQTIASAPPLGVLIQDVSAERFVLQLVRLDSLQTAESALGVHVVVVEEGVYERASSGVVMDAFRIPVSTVDMASSTRDTWQGMSGNWGARFQKPVILGQVVAPPDQRWSQFWASGTNTANPPAATGARIGRHVGEDPNPFREDAELHVLVVEQGMGWMGGLPYEAGVGADVVESMTHLPPYLYPLAGSIPEPLAAVLSPAGIDNIQGYLPVLYGDTPLVGGALALSVDEDRFKDKERNHPTEQLAWLLLGAPIAEAEPEPEIAALRAGTRERPGAPAERPETAATPRLERLGQEVILEWTPHAGDAPGEGWELWESSDLRLWEKSFPGLRQAGSAGLAGRSGLRIRAPLVQGSRQRFFRWRLVPEDGGSAEAADGDRKGGYSGR